MSLLICNGRMLVDKQQEEVPGGKCPTMIVPRSGSKLLPYTKATLTYFSNYSTSRIQVRGRVGPPHVPSLMTLLGLLTAHARRRSPIRASVCRPWSMLYVTQVRLISCW